MWENMEMGQSLVLMPVHIVFSTKDHRPMIDDEVADRLHAYLATVCNGMGCCAIQVGGTDDHVHVLLYQSKNVSIGDLLEHIKMKSSKWIKTFGKTYNDFYWQRGYGSFGIGIGAIPAVQNYIIHQREHHRKRTFKDEFRAFLKKYKIEFDERYVWD